MSKYAWQASCTDETSPADGAADAAPTMPNGTARPTKATLSRLNETLLMTFPSATLTPSPRTTCRQPPDRCSPDAQYAQRIVLPDGAKENPLRWSGGRL